jgi:TonB family protein
MNRLQKKCIIGTVGIHLLLATILIVGPAFFNQEPKLDNTQILDVIPANLVDAAVNSGVKNAQPPAPTPTPVTAPKPFVVQLPPPLPTPQPQPQPPTPAPVPAPSLLDRMKNYFEPKPTPTVTPNLTPVEKHTETQQNNIKVDTHLVKRTDQKNTPRTDNAQNARAINNALRSLSHSLSSATTVDMPGNSSAAYASYASVVKSVYDRALLSHVPSEVANKDEKARVKVVIGSDGTVISSEVISPSGDPAWDDAVQRTLDSVTFVAPFPDGATEKERTYTLGFSPEVEQSLQ